MEELKSSASLLIVRIKRGDESAFERLYSIYFPRIVFYAKQYLSNPEEAKEIAQEVFLTVWQKRERLDISLDPQPYLLTITRNRCISILRKRLQERNYQSKMQGNEEMANYLALCHQSAETILSVEIENIIKEVMAGFPEPTRKVFAMSRSENMTYDEIAECLDVSVGTVEYRMMKALKSFREKLKDYLPFLFLGVIF